MIDIGISRDKDTIELFDARAFASVRETGRNGGWDRINQVLYGSGPRAPGKVADNLGEAPRHILFFFGSFSPGADPWGGASIPGVVDCRDEHQLLYEPAGIPRSFSSGWRRISRPVNSRTTASATMYVTAFSRRHPVSAWPARRARRGSGLQDRHHPESYSTEAHHLPAAFKHDIMRLRWNDKFLRTSHHPSLPERAKKEDGAGLYRFIPYELMRDSQKIFAVIDRQDKYPAERPSE